MKTLSLFVLLSMSLLFNIGYSIKNSELRAQLTQCQSKQTQRADRRAGIQTYLIKKYRVKSVEASRLADYFLEAAAEYNLDPYLIVAQSYAESSFINHALSNKGAVGLMQIMPQFWARGQIEFIKGVEDLYNPRLNVRAGAYILRYYLDKTGDMVSALRAYHGGIGAVSNPRQSTVQYVNTIQQRYMTI